MVNQSESNLHVHIQSADTLFYLQHMVTPSIHPSVHSSIQQTMIKRLPCAKPLEVKTILPAPRDCFYSLIKEIRQDMNTKN